MSRLALLAATALACAPHGPPLAGEVALARPIALLPIDACDGALEKIADASDAAGAGLGRDQQTYFSDRLPPEQEVFATGPSRQALQTFLGARPDLAPPAGRRYGYEEVVAHDGVARWRMHCMLAQGLELRALASASVVDEEDGRVTVRIAMTAADARAFRALTESHLDRRIAIVDGDEVLMAPVVKTPIPGGVVSIDLGAGEREPRLAANELLGRLLGR